jgi:hypothetical protein
MRKLILLFGLFYSIAFAVDSKAQLLNTAKNYVDSKSGGYTEKDAADAIKEALSKGTSEGVKLVSKTDGYFGNKEIKIPFPDDVKDIESKLRSIGLGDKVDEVILSMNRAAEDAAKDAETIFLNAIKSMTIQDAINIVRGNNNAATQYLKKTTSPELTTKFRPVIKASLDKVNATKLWTELIKSYNEIPFVKKKNPDLTEYVTQKAIDGLFLMIAKKEADIRKDPMAQTSDLLKKVFGK